MSGGKAISIAKRAIIRCLKKWAGRHPLFVEAVPAPLQFISRLFGVSAQPHSQTKLIELLKRDYPPMLPLFAIGAAWSFLRQMGLPAATQSWQENIGAFEHFS